MDRNRLRAALDGDRDARVELGYWMSRELRAYFSTFPRNDAHDLVQDTAEALIKKIASAPDDPEAFRIWMLRFAKVQSRKFIARQRRARLGANRLLHRGEARTPTALQLFEMRLQSKQRQLLAWAIGQLPDNLRDALEHHLAGHDHKSLAHARGVSVRTADWMIWKATNVLRKLLQAARLTRPSMRSSSSS